jgi:hypothetical protein
VVLHTKEWTDNHILKAVMDAWDTMLDVDAHPQTKHHMLSFH